MRRFNVLFVALLMMGIFVTSLQAAPVKSAMNCRGPKACAKSKQACMTKKCPQTAACCGKNSKSCKAQCKCIKGKCNSSSCCVRNCKCCKDGICSAPKCSKCICLKSVKSCCNSFCSRKEHHHKGTKGNFAKPKVSPKK